VFSKLETCEHLPGSIALLGKQKKEVLSKREEAYPADTSNDINRRKLRLIADDEVNTN